ncbi:hypothetical protein ACWGIA_02250 [Streptomyces bobili]
MLPGGDTNCLETAAAPTTLHLRESDTPATTLTALLAAVKAATTSPR